LNCNGFKGFDRRRQRRRLNFGDLRRPTAVVPLLGFSGADNRTREVDRSDLFLEEYLRPPWVTFLRSHQQGDGLFVQN